MFFLSFFICTYALVGFVVLSPLAEERNMYFGSFGIVVVFVISSSFLILVIFNDSISINNNNNNNNKATKII